MYDCMLYLKVFFIILISGLPNKSSIRLAGSSDGSRVLWVQPRKHLTDKLKKKTVLTTNFLNMMITIQHKQTLD